MTRDSDTLYTEDCRAIRQGTYDLLSKTNEITRLTAAASPLVHDLVDSAVRQAVDLQRLLENFTRYVEIDPASRREMHKRLADSLARATAGLESAVQAYGASKASSAVGARSTQLKMMHEIAEQQRIVGGATKSASGQSGMRDGHSLGSLQPHDFNYQFIESSKVHSLEEGLQHERFAAIRTIDRQMTDLNQIYVALHDTASSQSGVLNTVQESLHMASNSASLAVRQISEASSRMDYWTRVKVYGASAVGGLLFLVWNILT